MLLHYWVLVELHIWYCHNYFIRKMKENQRNILKCHVSCSYKHNKWDSTPSFTSTTWCKLHILPKPRHLGEFLEIFLGSLALIFLFSYYNNAITDLIEHLIFNQLKYLLVFNSHTFYLYTTIQIKLLFWFFCYLFIWIHNFS